ncbi:MAG: BON domain-containing protein [Solirubrobacterales bacterium]|nr:BON domain-containing protein [Solirubrobacterales bacterium]
MIEVAAQGDFVTLRGTVETLRERHAAIDDARQIDGVREIDDQLALELGGSDRRGDEKICGVALQKLIRDPEVPAEAIKVKVRNGWVALSGYVEYEAQRVAAYDDVAILPGVTGITDEILVLSC